MRDALLDALALKDIARAGWEQRGLTDVESVAAHSWGMCLLALVTAPPALDRARLLTYAVLHDLAEAWTGDHTPSDGVSATDKLAAETRAMRSLMHRLDRPELMKTWLDYERQVDAEARFVRELDRLDMALQAERYRSRGLDPTEFLESAARVVETPELVELLPDRD